MPIFEHELKELTQLVADRSGISFPLKKKKSANFIITSCMKKCGYASLAGLIKDLRSQEIPSPLWDRLISELTVGETYFYRNKFHLAALEQLIFPQLAVLVQGTGSMLRFWSAGCATGEEPYTLAMLVKETNRFDPQRVRITASDINNESLGRARQGSYSNWSFRGTPAYIKERYFEEKEGRFQIIKQIKDMVTFENRNLVMADYPRNHFDLVICRNVLIYFERKISYSVIEKMYATIRPGGWLILGESEPRASDIAPFMPFMVNGLTVYHKEKPGYKVNAKGSVFTAEPLIWDASDFTTPASQAADIPILTHNSETKALDESCDSAIEMNLPTTEHCKASDESGDGRAALTSAEVMKVKEESVSLLLQKAFDAADNGDTTTAQLYCEQVLRHNPLHVEGHFLLGQCFMEREEFAEAKKKFKKTLFLDGNHVPSLLALISISRLKGDETAEKRLIFRLNKVLESRKSDEVVDHKSGITIGDLIAELNDFAGR